MRIRDYIGLKEQLDDTSTKVNLKMTESKLEGMKKQIDIAKNAPKRSEQAKSIVKSVLKRVVKQIVTSLAVDASSIALGYMYAWAYIRTEDEVLSDEDVQDYTIDSVATIQQAVYHAFSAYQAFNGNYLSAGMNFSNAQQRASQMLQLRTLTPTYTRGLAMLQLAGETGANILRQAALPSNAEELLAIATQTMEQGLTAAPENMSEVVPASTASSFLTRAYEFYNSIDGGIQRVVSEGNQWLFNPVTQTVAPVGRGLDAIIPDNVAVNGFAQALRTATETLGALLDKMQQALVIGLGADFARKVHGLVGPPRV